MNFLLEIDEKDIEQLNDVQLRELVGLLCESDMRKAKMSSTSVTWGGHQNEEDGGIDVRVRCSKAPPSSSNIPRRDTVFQVKKSDMPKSALKNELIQDGELRESIAEVINSSGAYIIVSGKSSETDLKLKNRLKALKELLKQFDPEDRLYTDYFDSKRISTWLRDHPPLILWVRKTIGRNLQGWQPYANWSKSPEGLYDNYIIDSKINLTKQQKEDVEGDSFKTRLQEFREDLSKPGCILRLVGMSGVGKTRLVQALFDERVGLQALEHSEVVYGDLSDELLPTPISILRQLCEFDSTSLLIVDNCPTNIHTQLASEIEGRKSRVRILTIEHDIQDNLPDKTLVYHLTNSTSDLIKMLIKRRFSHLDDSVVYQIARFSDGNSRVAIYLANALDKGESIGTLNDQELIDRLFQWKGAPNESILESAELLSLVYSFNGEDISGEKSELVTLCSLIDKNVNKVLRDVVIMQEKGIIQQRSKWRAIMPPALANKLAIRSFKIISSSILLETFMAKSSDRLVTSLAHRMSLLRDNPKIVEIVSSWLSPDGFLNSKLRSNEEVGLKMLKYIARITPSLTLTAIENKIEKSDRTEFLSKSKNPYSVDYVKLLKVMSYYDEYFQRCTKILIEFALSETTYNAQDSIKDEVASLFNPYSSRTSASHRTRIGFFNDLITKYEDKNREIIVKILDEALEYAEFERYSRYDLDPRTSLPFNRPQSEEEEKDWYISFLSAVKNSHTIDEDLYKAFREIVAEKFRELWTRRQLHLFLFDYVKEMQDFMQWNEMWAQVHATIRYDTKRLAADSIQLLADLRNYLKPTSLEQLIRAYAMIDNNRFIDIDEIDEPDRAAREEAEIKKIEKIRGFGKKLVEDPRALASLLPDMIICENRKIFHVGYGIASATTSPMIIWNEIKAHLISDNIDSYGRVALAEGFVRYHRVENLEIFDRILDEVSADKRLSKFLVIFHCMGPLDEKGYKRLMDDLNQSDIDMDRYYDLYWKRDVPELGEEKYIDLIEKISSKKGGPIVAANILSYGYAGYNHEPEPPSEQYLRCTRKVIENYEFIDGPSGIRDRDYCLAELVNHGLRNSQGSSACKTLLINLCNYLREKHRKNQFEDTLKAIRKVQTTVFLDIISEKENAENYNIVSIIGYSQYDRNDFLNEISSDSLFDWIIVKEHKHRIRFVFEHIDLFYFDQTEKRHRWKQVVYHVLNRFHQYEDLFSLLMKPFHPSSWPHGTLSKIRSSRSTLIFDLVHCGIEPVSKWATAMADELAILIEETKQHEAEMERRDRQELSFE